MALFLGSLLLSILPWRRFSFMFVLFVVCLDALTIMSLALFTMR